MKKLTALIPLFVCACAAFAGPDPTSDSGAPAADAAGVDADADSAADADASMPTDASVGTDASSADAASAEACTDDVDLCRASGAPAGSPTFDPDAYTMFTIPSAPKANQAFDLYIVTKNQSLSSPGLLKNGAICYGGGLSKPCASPGVGCAGWKVGFFKGVSENAGTYNFTIKDPMGPTGCEGAAVATLKVIVVN